MKDGRVVRAHGLEVMLGDDQNLHVVGSDLVIENPFLGKGLELDLGQLWLSIWAEGQHNKQDQGRLRALLLNAAQASVMRVLSILKEEA